jgi:ATP-dependent Lhr-like helicase
MPSADSPLLDGFHPTVQGWFASRLGVPSPPQEHGWPSIRKGRNTLIAAPTGTGKTLAAFLWALDDLLRQGDALDHATQVLYVSPLKALGNDVQKNLQTPLAELREMDASLPDVRVLVRSGDTPPSQRQAMLRRPPHILVTTPESLYILLTSDGGRGILSTVRTVIIDEIHAVAGDKRGAHLALSLERLDALLPEPAQRIGLSATQKPLEDVAHLLVGVDRECELVDVGHRRELDLALEVPESLLDAVCSHETWEEIYRRMAQLIDGHRTTLVFVNTRKLAERVAARLSDVVGEDRVSSHHGSLSRERRLQAEERLKAGALRALVATASLELGIDVGDVDLVIQVGVTPSIATFLQRVGRAGHALSRTPKGRIFPLTQDELVCAAALLEAVQRGELDRTPQPGRPLDILMQQVVAACVPETWEEEELFRVLRRAWPYRELERRDFDRAVALHTQGRYALLHRDGVGGRLRATRRARIPALTSGGAIPDTADYRVVLEPEGTPVGSVHEDFAVEANRGDVFQLGNASWSILKVEAGLVRVADARGMPPTLPFWVAEGPSRTRELSAAVGAMRSRAADPVSLAGLEASGVPEPAARQLHEYVNAGAAALGAVPTPECVILERFFDESGGMQLVLHAPFGGRINRAWGLALRKKFCRGFGFELQAAANEDSIVLSLGPQHSFPLEEVLDYLRPETVRDTLVQAVLPTPMFTARWRWNVSRALVLPRTQHGKRVPSPLLRMRADDELARAFPEVLACGETLPPGDLPIPWEHPLVQQTLEDCLHEAMDIDGLADVLQGMRDGRIRHVAVDTPEPSAFAKGILNAMPYAFLDDAPLEERRTQAVLSRRVLDQRTVDDIGALDPDAVRRVREEAWPDPENDEEAHEALLWMGYVRVSEAAESSWSEWLATLEQAGRVVRDGDAWFAAESSREPRQVILGRLEALGPVFVGDGEAVAESERGVLRQLEGSGAVLRCRLEGREAWCERRLLARVQRYTLERLRREIEPVTAAVLWRYLLCWQHVDPDYQLEGPRGVAEVIQQLAGFEIPAAAWEASILPARVKRYRPEWLDQLTLTGEVAWTRLWGTGASPIRSTPLCMIPRENMDAWLELAGHGATEEIAGNAAAVLEHLQQRGASFSRDVERSLHLIPSHLETALGDLIAQGRITCDSWSGVRRLLTPAAKRKAPRRGAAPAPTGRWSLVRNPHDDPAGDQEPAAFAAQHLLARYGVVFRRLLDREKLPVPWRDLVRVYRHQELQGSVRGGRFVQRFSGEQFALPEAVALLRKVRRREDDGERAAMHVAAADPLNLQGILTPDERVSPQTRRRVQVR